MFFVSTDNKLYYHGENNSGRGGVGHANKVLEFEEVILKTSDDTDIDISLVIDFAEIQVSSLILLNTGEVYIASVHLPSRGQFIKVNIENIVRICSTKADFFLLNGDGELYQLSNTTSFPIKKIEVSYDMNVSEPIKKIKKIGSSNVTINQSSYSSVYYIDEDNNLYTYEYDFKRKTSFTGKFAKCLDNVYTVTGASYSTSTWLLYAIDTDGKVFTFGNFNGNGRSVEKISQLIGDRNFKIYNTDTQLSSTIIIDIIYINASEMILVYREDDELKYAYATASSSPRIGITGVSLATTNKFHEIIPSEDNFNFQRFDSEFLLDSIYPMMYMWEKETGDLYMAGADYTVSLSTPTYMPLTKVELPENRKVKRLKNSKLYHNYKDVTVPIFDPILTTSMFPDGAFDSSKSGFKVWDGEKYDRALFVEELDGKYQYDISKAKNPMKIQTSNGEKMLATYNMVEYPIYKEEDVVSIVGEAIVGKSEI